MRSQEAVAGGYSDPPPDRLDDRVQTATPGGSSLRKAASIDSSGVATGYSSTGSSAGPRSPPLFLREERARRGAAYRSDLLGAVAVPFGTQLFRSRYVPPALGILTARGRARREHLVVGARRFEPLTSSVACGSYARQPRSAGTTCTSAYARRGPQLPIHHRHHRAEIADDHRGDRWGARGFEPLTSSASRKSGARR